MTIITEDYVSFEVAKLLKEKGFDEPTRGTYYKDGTFEHLNINRWNSKFIIPISAPTLQMAMRWLREVHHYYIQVMLDSWACGGHMGYYVVIQKTDSDFEMMLQDVVNDVFYQTHEQACEEAILYCLKNLI